MFELGTSESTAIRSAILAIMSLHFVLSLIKADWQAS